MPVFGSPHREEPGGGPGLAALRAAGLPGGQRGGYEAQPQGAGGEGGDEDLQVGSFTAEFAEISS